MKKVYGLLLLVLMMIAVENVKAQFSAGVDLYSSYVWRGTQFGKGPAVQPSVGYSAGGFSVGAWGSVCTSDLEGFEMDLSAGYDFDFGLSLLVTDYYFGIDPTSGAGWLTSDMHSIEPSISYSIGNFSLTGAYMKGLGSSNISDVYFEAGYSFKSVSLFVGAGDGQYTSDSNFNVCNVGISTSKEIKVTDDFSIPVSGSVILNPSTEGFFIVVGISL